MTWCTTDWCFYQKIFKDVRLLQSEKELMVLNKTDLEKKVSNLGEEITKYKQQISVSS